MTALGTAFANLTATALEDGMLFLSGFAGVIVILVGLGIAMYVYNRLVG